MHNNKNGLFPCKLCTAVCNSKTNLIVHFMMDHKSVVEEFLEEHVEMDEVEYEILMEELIKSKNKDNTPESPEICEATEKNDDFWDKLWEPSDKSDRSKAKKARKEETNLKCEYKNCGFSTDSKFVMKMHSKIHNGDGFDNYEYRCDYCSAVCISSTSLKLHLTRDHK